MVKVWVWDDQHGRGRLGEWMPTEPSAYGFKGP
jgi:hypothetical protein